MLTIKGEEEFEFVVVFGVADVAIDKAEVEGKGEEDEKAEPDTFAAHGCSVR